MTTRCRVCHRALTNPAHIAAGVGPVCAAKGTRYGVVASQAKTTEETERVLDEATRAVKLAQLERVWVTLMEWRHRCEDEISRVAGLQRWDQVEIGRAFRAHLQHRMARVAVMRDTLTSAAAPRRAA